MKRLILSLSPLLLLCACEALPIDARNACVPDAIRVRDTLVPRHWAAVLIVRRDAPSGHAYCIFEEGGRLRAYDCLRGTRILKTAARNPDALARELEPDSLGGHWL